MLLGWPGSGSRTAPPHGEATAHDDHLGPGDRHVGNDLLASMQPTGVAAGGEFTAEHEREVHRVQPVGVMRRVKSRRGSRSRQAVGCCTMNPGARVVGLRRPCRDLSASMQVVPTGRSRRMLRMPISAQSRCLAPTYHWLPGSSPTSTVPNRTTPRSAARAGARSPLIVSDGACRQASSQSQGQSFHGGSSAVTPKTRTTAIWPTTRPARLCPGPQKACRAVWRRGALVP